MSKRAFQKSLASFPTKQISRSTPAAVAVSEWLHIFHIPHQERQPTIWSGNKLALLEVGYGIREKHTFICQIFAVDIMKNWMPSNFAVDFGNLPHQEAKKHQGFIMS